MFRCHFTGKLSRPGEQPQKLVTELRDVIYYRFNSKSGSNEEMGRGTEIVKEVMVSTAHYNKLMTEGFTPRLTGEVKHEVYHPRINRPVRENLEQE